ncbi:MAG: DUF4199 domain-containing protein, partial [Chitinophagales bacterium]|nr:DUF4199 domain-containing protein [Chitinophagales bacterium]
MIASYMMLYLINAELLASFFTIILYGFAIFFMIYAGITFRKENNGYKSYLQAFLVVFITGIIAAFAIDIYGYVFFNFIDPSMVEVVKEAAIKKTADLYEKLNLPDDQVERYINEIKYQDFRPTITSLSFRMLASAIITAIFSALIAVFVRRNDTTTTIR